MYLKSIEINGFKSFANKILFEFHDGITAIVGPNGSGKSNVADAVRWVLGEQSAKQLRGANMTDVIFAGSEVRKPMTFAYVCITFDNSDHVLAPDFDEISVSRRVYRSGESEYMINKTVCRLKDVQELFMDTGIGKEGYSIIGQGQIDRILSTKPEDRRELFDEAAGIVKFKKRKAIAIKNLEEERNNLSRVRDILDEINSRVGPLSEQAEIAKEYLRLKEQLKIREVNQYLLEYDRSESQCESIEEKLKIAKDEYDEAVKGREGAQDEYNRLDERIAGFNSELDEKREKKNADALRITELEGEIKLLNGQIAASMQNDSLISSRIEAIGKDIEVRNKDLEGLKTLKDEIAAEKKKLDGELLANNENLNAVHEETKKLEDESTEFNTSIKQLVEEKGKVKTELQKFETILEQNDIKKSELEGQLITNKSEETAAKNRKEECERMLEKITAQLEENLAKQEEIKASIEKSDAKIKALRAEHEKKQQEFVAERSKLESLKNLAERYEGYGSSIQKIMSHRASVRGIEGVVADLISVEKKYEIAIETALGAGIQNIVVDTEQTAKHLISFLKVNRAGRATFLPLTSVKERERRDDHSSEKGVIGVAASLVKTDKKYQGVIGYLLGRIIVVDNIDNALALAKKNDYSLRIVTLEGEQLNPGGSLSGGAYRNQSNLLGRKREIEELEGRISELEKEVSQAEKQVNDAISDRRDLFGRQDDLKASMQELKVSENNASVGLRNEEDRLKRIMAAFDEVRQQLHEIELKSGTLRQDIDTQKEAIKTNDESSRKMEESIALSQEKLEFLRKKDAELSEENTTIREALSGINQKEDNNLANLYRVETELDNLSKDRDLMLESAGRSEAERKEMTDKAGTLEAEADGLRVEVKDLENSISEILGSRDRLTAEHKGFMAKWQELGDKVTALDKETYRLSGQLDRLKEQLEAQTNYIWDEYELTISTAREYRDEGLKNPATIKKDIAQLKNDIKNLGDVNVGAIEEFKAVSERRDFLSVQLGDLEKSEATIVKIIEDLDSEMRRQFTERFAIIRQQFAIVFKELFGGGKADLELTQDEDVLEAGILVSAQPPGKKLVNMMQLSGGEKALTAISLLFAILNMKPSPFCLLDEIEAALDDSNVKRYATYLKKLTKHSQFIVITHRRGTMSAADIMYGITMQEKGVSTLVSVSLLEDDLQ